MTISEKHGLNPTVPVCFFCLKEKNEVLLLGRLRGDLEAPHKAVFDYEPCDECAGFMDKGIILISVDPEKTLSDKDNPYRTGGWCVVKSEAISRWPLPEQSIVNILKKRVAFIEDELWDKIGLPRGQSPT